MIEAVADAAHLLLGWLSREAATDAVTWLEDQLGTLGQGSGKQRLFVAMGQASRRFSKAEMRLDEADLASARGARPGWNPRGWSLADAARILILVDLSRREADFAALFRDLCRTADVAEAIAFYRGLPLYDRPAELESQAAEGARSNMRVVFEAVAHRNPYPRECFDEQRWNHMILKALFVGAPLAPVQGLDERANPRLAAMLRDFAHERWAAGRTVSPELWRCVGPFADEAAIADFQRLFQSKSSAERGAAVLALSACAHPAAKSLLEAHGDSVAEIASGSLTWSSLAL